MPEHPPDTTSAARYDRRAFLRRGLLAGGALVGGGFAADQLLGGGRAAVPLARAGRPLPRRPNILVIVVDQMRTPRWFGAGTTLPAISALAARSVSFDRHYTASNDCTPSRAVLVTGLYTHQTGCMITGRSTLDPGFPTWGTLLRRRGYGTWWYGKWHLSKSDTLEPWGFAGGTYPSPDGAPGQGLRADPQITRQFRRWFARHSEHGPWCTTVSFVNPHDISWWYRYTAQDPGESSAPGVFSRLPPNFETPDQMQAMGKPLLQRSLQDNAAHAFGAVPFTGPDVVQAWTGFLDLYLSLQRHVDRQVGHVLATLASRPAVAANTVVVFTSDHGEYGGSHGMRGKGAGVYEEAIHVPLHVYDPRGDLTAAVGTPRQGLTSSADLTPLLLQVADPRWRDDPACAHLLGRHDLGAMLASPAAPGRDHVLHATDEIATEFAPQPYAADAPLHVTALRTAAAKYATYSFWTPGTIEIDAADQQRELYEYRDRGGRLELDNRAGSSAQESTLDSRLQRAIEGELREPVPAVLADAQRRGFADYHRQADRAGREASRARAASAGPTARRRTGRRRPARAAARPRS